MDNKKPLAAVWKKEKLWQEVLPCREYKQKWRYSAEDITYGRFDDTGRQKSNGRDAAKSAE